ncbi:hypothetical protein GCM10012285_24440 [Streptomyces kronopolitis]|uniref:AB hydrolase-1 domain-containing protein n=1 Tax=Streptomyces kronopolitis TaxID=1612435 RepID=A0ABQ2JCJ5_9ACTN|nr:alpha/beta fold hydrolase [Streptomyces kronopolitis]GGN43244.1 hypothetical protein GCM10012285_24440 [Streptomyces kronopolitis]
MLLFNPGGPGAAGLKWPLLMKWDLPKAVQSQYDLVGFDPRGVGESTPVTCGLKPEEQESAPRPYKPETFSKDVAWSQAVAHKCRRKAGARFSTSLLATLRGTWTLCGRCWGEEDLLCGVLLRHLPRRCVQSEVSQPR